MPDREESEEETRPAAGPRVRLCVFVSVCLVRTCVWDPPSTSRSPVWAGTCFRLSGGLMTDCGGPPKCSVFQLLKRLDALLPSGGPLMLRLAVLRCVGGARLFVSVPLIGPPTTHSSTCQFVGQIHWAPSENEASGALLPLRPRGSRTAPGAPVGAQSLALVGLSCGARSCREEPPAEAMAPRSAPGEVSLLPACSGGQGSRSLGHRREGEESSMPAWGGRMRVGGGKQTAVAKCPHFLWDRAVPTSASSSAPAWLPLNVAASMFAESALCLPHTRPPGDRGCSSLQPLLWVTPPTAAQEWKWAPPGGWALWGSAPEPLS